MVQLKVVLDTSILISALKTRDPRRSPAIRVLELLKKGTLQNYGSRDTLKEMKETLAIIGLLVGKPEKAKAIYNLIQNHTKRVSPRVKFEDDTKMVELVGHPDDVKFLNVVYTSKARYLLSMNTKHLVELRDKRTLKFNLKRHWFYIMTAGEFLRHIREKYKLS
ncbi:putative toxin-antitoxin system toxin component, PIN family [Thermococcus atlanticus]